MRQNNDLERDDTAKAIQPKVITLSVAAPFRSRAISSSQPDNFLLNKDHEPTSIPPGLGSGLAWPGTDDPGRTVRARVFAHALHRLQLEIEVGSHRSQAGRSPRRSSRADCGAGRCRTCARRLGGTTACRRRRSLPSASANPAAGAICTGAAVHPRSAARRTETRRLR